MGGLHAVMKVLNQLAGSEAPPLDLPGGCARNRRRRRTAGKEYRSAARSGAPGPERPHHGDYALGSRHRL